MLRGVVWWRILSFRLWVLNVPASSTTPKRRRSRLLRYSLRSLFVATAVIGVLLAMYVVPAERQRRAVAVIEDAGGHVFYGYDLEGQEMPWLGRMLGRDYAAESHDAWLVGETDAPFIAACQLRTLRGINLMHGDAPDSRLLLLADLKDLRELHLQRAAVTDDGLALLAGMVHLEVLLLDECPITDKGLGHFRTLRSLRALGLSGTSITDAGMCVLAKLPNLEVLSINETVVSDDGLAELHSCDKLMVLTIWNTSTTERGISRFREQCPQCEVVWPEGELLSVPPVFEE